MGCAVVWFTKWRAGLKYGAGGECWRRACDDGQDGLGAVSKTGATDAWDGLNADHAIGNGKPELLLQMAEVGFVRRGKRIPADDHQPSG